MSLSDAIPLRFRNGALVTGKALQQINNILIATHVNPDGDALGAMAAAGFLLKRLNKNFALYSPNNQPEYLRFLQLPGVLYHDLADIPFAIQAVLVLDCSEAHRLGDDLAALMGQWPCANIDHHICPKGLGTLANFIDTKAAATCQLLAYVALSLNEQINNELGFALALGLLTDTGNFCHGNTDAAVFALAAELEQANIRLPELTERLQGGLTLEHMRLWGRLFARIELHEQGALAFCAVSLDDLHETGARVEDTDGFAEYLRRLKDVRIAAVLREIHPGKCKFSLRSRSDCNVQAIANTLGGGGHKNAAGGVIAQPLLKARETLLQAIGAASCGQ